MDFTFGVAVGAVIALYVLMPTIQDQREKIAEQNECIDDLLDEIEDQEAMDQRFREANNKIFQRRLTT